MLLYFIINLSLRTKEIDLVAVQALYYKLYRNYDFSMIYFRRIKNGWRERFSFLFFVRSILCYIQHKVILSCYFWKKEKKNKWPRTKISFGAHSENLDSCAGEWRDKKPFGVTDRDVYLKKRKPFTQTTYVYIWDRKS